MKDAAAAVYLAELCKLAIFEGISKLFNLQAKCLRPRAAAQLSYLHRKVNFNFCTTLLVVEKINQ